MVQNYTVWVEKKAYPVVVSDEREALLAAKAAGRVFVGLIHMENGMEYQEKSEPDSGAEQICGVAEKEYGSDTLWDAEYLAAPEAISPEYLERIVRRHVSLPWIIAETDRLLIREFTPDDIPQMPEEPDAWYTEEERTADKIFYDKDKLESYIKSQYRFYEYGIWAVIRKSDGVIVGKAGVTNLEEPEQGESENKTMLADESEYEIMPAEKSEHETVPTDESAEYLELGYHIFRPYRRQGYVEEACRAILNYAKEELACPVCARVAKENTASIQLLEKLGVPYYLK